MNDDELSKLIQRSATRHTASERLRAGVHTQIALQAAAREDGPRAAARRWFGVKWRSGMGIGVTGFVSGAALTLFLGWFVPRLVLQQELPQELVADHVRSLKVGPLFEVASSDRHTVKPWFQGRLDYAPPVVDLAGAGFALLGGRIEHVSGNATAALTYERGHHVLNVFVWPADAKPQAAQTTQIRGFNLLHWSDGAMQVWAVSDIEPGELTHFREAWIAGKAPVP